MPTNVRCIERLHPRFRSRAAWCDDAKWRLGQRRALSYSVVHHLTSLAPYTKSLDRAQPLRPRQVKIYVFQMSKTGCTEGQISACFEPVVDYHTRFPRSI
jgi:hypothetical protein